MENYMDGSFVVSQQTIIHYSGTQVDLTVPGQFADIAVSRIGDGAFMECPFLKTVILPRGLKQIGQDAFADCNNLTQITIPSGTCDIGSAAFGHCKNLRAITICDLELTPQEYQSYKSNAIRNPDGVYIMRKMPDQPRISKVVSAFVDSKAAYEVPDETDCLFQTAQIAQTVNVNSLHSKWDVLGVTQPSAQISENDAFRAHITRSVPEFYDGKTEQKMDAFVRVGKDPAMVKTVILTFDDTKTKEKNGNFLVQFTFRRGYFFWQSAQAVMHEGEKYYIYRRHYLSDEADMKYVRRDFAVYTDKGLVMNRREAQNVYAKYRLLSIL